MRFYYDVPDYTGDKIISGIKKTFDNRSLKRIDSNIMEKIFIEEFISSELVQSKVREMGIRITADYVQEDDIILIGLLKSSVFFLADLSRIISLNLKIDFIHFSNNTFGNPDLKKGLEEDITGKHVIIVDVFFNNESIPETVKNYLLSKKPASIKLCTLLDIPDRRNNASVFDYIGFTLPDIHPIGYGIGFKDQKRSLPYIGRISKTY